MSWHARSGGDPLAALATPPGLDHHDFLNPARIADKDRRRR